MTVREAAGLLQAALRSLEQAIDLTAPVLPDPPPEIAALETATLGLLDALSDIEQSLSSSIEPLEELHARLESDDIVSDLVNLIETEAKESATAFDTALGDFESLGEELAQSATDELEEWLTNAVDALGDELSGAVGEIEQAVADGASNLGSSIKTAVTDLGDNVRDRIEERARQAVGDVIEAATDRALAEVAETIMTMQTGAMITTAIGPYLPAIIAIKPALPAIQDALDMMRGGF